jgi:hypothetical protein
MKYLLLSYTPIARVGLLGARCAVARSAGGVRHL